MSKLVEAIRFYRWEDLRGIVEFLGFIVVCYMTIFKVIDIWYVWVSFIGYVAFEGLYDVYVGYRALHKKNDHKEGALSG